MLLPYFDDTNSQKDREIVGMRVNIIISIQVKGEAVARPEEDALQMPETAVLERCLWQCLGTGFPLDLLGW